LEINEIYNVQHGYILFILIVQFLLLEYDFLGLEQLQFELGLVSGREILLRETQLLILAEQGHHA
jgi:hypothetical protein